MRADKVHPIPSVLPGHAVPGPPGRHPSLPPAICHRVSGAAAVCTVELPVAVGMRSGGAGPMHGLALPEAVHGPAVSRVDGGTGGLVHHHWVILGRAAVETVYHLAAPTATAVLATPPGTGTCSHLCGPTGGDVAPVVPIDPPTAS